MKICGKSVLLESFPVSNSSFSFDYIFFEASITFCVCVGGGGESG